MKSKRDIWRDAKRRWVLKNPDKVIAARLNRKPIKRKQKKEYFRDEFRRLRKKALSILGGKCIICGIEDKRVLQVDHINRTEQGVSVILMRRKPGGRRTSNNTQFYRNIIKGKIGSDEVQLLCANCHAIKTWEGNERPYQIDDTGDPVAEIKFQLKLW
jgi:hypothetical protein